VFGRTIFGGSRFLFWALAPFLVLFAVVMGLLVSDWTSRRGVLAAALIGAALLLLLQLYDGIRFHWAGRVLAGSVFLAYATYFVRELATTRSSRLLVVERAEPSPIIALVGLLVIGLPAGLYALFGRWSVSAGSGDAADVAELQRVVCRRYAAPFTPCEPSMKIGISESAVRGELPLNGLRHRLESGTSGWYIWGGAELSSVLDFFKPMHIQHLSERCPEVLPYLALPPGWRFLVAPETEDVWFDESLLQPERGLTSR
jgi:hypothetical protein